MRSLIGAGLWWRTWNYCGPLGGGNTGTWCWKWPKKAHSLYKALRIDATAQAFLAEALAMTQLWHGATCGFWVWLWRKEVGSALVTEDMEEGSLVDFLQGQSLLMLHRDCLLKFSVDVFKVMEYLEGNNFWTETCLSTICQCPGTKWPMTATSTSSRKSLAQGQRQTASQVHSTWGHESEDILQVWGVVSFSGESTPLGQCFIQD